MTVGDGMAVHWHPSPQHQILIASSASGEGTAKHDVRASALLVELVTLLNPPNPCALPVEIPAGHQETLKFRRFQKIRRRPKTMNFKKDRTVEL